MTKPKAIILTGYGLNCEQETAWAFELAGASVDILHINDLIAKPKILTSYQILAVPGGFSYGDDLGSGRAYANKLNNHLREYLQKFAESDKLMIGICNGFQILTQTGLLPGALTFNNSNRYTDRWVDLAVSPSFSKRGPGGVSPWLHNINSLSLPIAHGEGKYIANKKTLSEIVKNNQIAGQYFKGEIATYQNLIPNPNGATMDIAMLTSKNGRILGTMPHPERGILFTQTPDWPLKKEQLLREGKTLPKFTNALKIFKNAVEYFK